MNTPKERSVKSGSHENSNLRVETVVEDEDSAGNAINEEDERFQGKVTPHNTITTPEIGSVHSIRSESNSTTSSWASKDDLRRQKRHEQKTKRGKKWSSIKNSRSRKETSVTPPRTELKRSKTPTTNNLSTGFFSEQDDSIEEEDLTASLLPPTEILYGETRDGRGAVHSRPIRTEDNQQFKAPPTQQHQQPSSFRKWMAEGMADTLRVVAGITLSTTGTILSPPIALTRALIPSIIALIVDTLDKATPQRFQDWFRIITSSVYHLFVVLVAGSTDRGQRFRRQITQVGHSFLEAWSAPESRQVVVDGMATGVKLADALHTPEMKIFLDQLGILGCRFGDAMASGKSKEFLLNFKELIWTSIELASDPSTTLALAEVTAHLCHALKEVDDSFNHATPRAVRNAQNEQTYLNSSLMTKDYPFESMEKVILSSLGMDGNNDENRDNDESVYDIGNGMDDSMSIEESIPSNVAFRVVGGPGSDPLEIPNLEQISTNKIGDFNKSHLEECKERVDLDLLQRKILNEGRPQARPSSDGSRAKAYSRSKGEKLQSNPSLFSETHEPQNNENLSEDYVKIEEDMEELPLLRDPRTILTSVEHRNPANTKELYDKFERMETKEAEKPSYVQFFAALDELMNKNRMKKEVRMRDCVAAEEAEGESRADNARKAKVRVLRKGIAKEEKIGSKAVRERYSNLRRSWKYPPSFLNLTVVGFLFACIFWVGFGMYGMYAMFQQVFYQGLVATPTNLEPSLPIQHEQRHPEPPIDNMDFGTKFSDAGFDSRQYDEKTNQYRPNEIVIRIVKEVVHVREDGSRIENYEKAHATNRITDEQRQESEGDVKISSETEKADDHEIEEEEINMIQNCVVSSLEVDDDANKDYKEPSSHDAVAALSQQEVDRVKGCLAQL